jgi:hypothetical protein
MDEKIAEQKQRERRQHRQIAPVPPGQDFRGDRRQERRREAQIEDGGGGRADLGGEQDGDAAHGPERDERRQGPALQRHPSRPVRNRRQEEAGNGSRREAEDHLMDMPDERRKRCRNLVRARKGRKPERDGKRCP